MNDRGGVVFDGMICLLEAECEHVSARPRLVTPVFSCAVQCGFKDATYGLGALGFLYDVHVSVMILE
jgi:hypothetical protein